MAKNKFDAVYYRENWRNVGQHVITLYDLYAQAWKYKNRFDCLTTCMNSPCVARYTNGFVWTTQMLVIQIHAPKFREMQGLRKIILIRIKLNYCIVCVAIVGHTIIKFHTTILLNSKTLPSQPLIARGVMMTMSTLWKDDNYFGVAWNYSHILIFRVHLNGFKRL